MLGFKNGFIVKGQESNKLVAIPKDIRNGLRFHKG